MLSNVRRARRPGLRRGLLVLGALGVWLVIGSFGGVAQGRLSDVQTNESAAFLPSNAESTLAGSAAREFEGDPSIPALVVLEAADGGQIQAAQLASVQAYAATLPSLPLPGLGTRVADGGEARLADVVADRPVAIPAEDGRAVLIPVSVLPEPAGVALAPGERPANAVVTALRSSLAEDLGAGPDGGRLALKAWVTGPAGFVADLVNAFGGIDGVLLLVALAAVFLILMLVYRSPLLPIVVIVTAVFALTGAGLVVYQLAKSGTIALSGQSQGILSILVVGASVDYCLLIVARYREELRRVAEPAAAMARALRASLAPIAASAGTVIAGLLCLLLSDLSSNRGLGPVGAIGIAASFLASMTLLPALMLVLGRRSRVLFWPRIPQLAPTADPGLDTDAVAVGPAGAGDPAGVSALWSRVARFVTSHARPVWVVTTLVLLAGAAALPSFRADGTDSADVFLTPVDSVAGSEVLAAHFPAGAVQPDTIIVPESGLAAALDAARQVPGVISAVPVTDAATGAPARSDDAGEPLVIDGRVRIDVVTASAADTRAAVATAQDLRDAVHAVQPEALVGGAAAENLDLNESGRRDLRVIIPAVLLVIFVILTLLLRSVVAAAVLVLANLLSFGAVLGASGLLLRNVLGFASSDSGVPLFAFVFLVALGVDYSIFLMTRVREESAVVGTREGVRRGLAVTGSVITSAGVVLAATFGALGVIPLSFLAQLALIVAFGVLVDTTVVRSLLVPAIVHDLGDRVWWPGHPSPSSA